LLLNLYTNLFEIYPFHNEKYGHAQFGWGGGMEHTTVSFMVGFDRQLVAHEMAHQWFGDKITCGSWKDIWLNESFATYVASMVYENFDGLSAFVSDKTNMVNYITSQPNGAVYLTDAEATDENRIFDNRLSYDKGAMVLEMLRFKMGDAAFFQALREYLADSGLAYGYAVTSNLQSHLESVYGNSLTEFFNDWIYNQGYPTYTITAQNWGAGQAKFTVNQTQSDPSVSYFEMLIPVRIHGANGEQQDIVLNNTTNGEVFIQPVSFPIVSIEFDPEVHLISKNNVVTLTNESFELDHAIEVYPNPISDVLHIQLPSNITIQKVDFYNNLGQLVLENYTTNSVTSTLSSGVYLIQIQTSVGTYHKKIIKK
ncbi:MAG: M1 family aminopeptidase, partial [Flavobacterium sp.]